jgi:hypothetical protein
MGLMTQSGTSAQIAEGLLLGSFENEYIDLSVRFPIHGRPMQDNEKEGNDLKANFLIGPTKKQCQKRGRGFFSR